MISTRNFLVLVGITLVLALATLLLTTKKPSSLAGGNQPFYPQLLAAVNDIVEVSMQSGSEQFGLLKQEGNWVVKEKSNYPADFNKVRKLLIGAAEMRIIEAKTSKAENYPKLGVEDISPQAQSLAVNLKNAKGESLANFLIGNQQAAKVDPTRSAIYVRKSGEAQAWLVVGNLTAPRAAVEWLNNNLLNIDRQRVRQVGITKPDDQFIGLSKEKPEDANYQLAGILDNMKLKSPYDVNVIAYTLETLTLEDVKPRAEMSFADKPLIKAVFDCFDGLQITLNLLTEGEKHYATIDAAYVAPEKKEDAKPEAEETAKKVQQEVEELNKRLGAWVYAIPQHKAIYLKRKREELFNPDVPPPANSQPPTSPETAPTVESPPPAQVIENLGK